MQPVHSGARNGHAHLRHAGFVWLSRSIIWDMLITIIMSYREDEQFLDICIYDQLRSVCI